MGNSEEQDKVIEIFESVSGNKILSKKAEKFMEENAYHYPPSFFERRFTV